MTNTDRFYEIVKTYRQDIEAVNARFDPEYRRLAAFSDSQYYASRKADVDRRRQAQIQGARSRAATSLDVCIGAMEREYATKSLAAPSPEQLRLLSALQMRETLSADEIRQAANTLKDCPVAVTVLRELAKKNHCSLDVQRELSGTEIQKHIESLRLNGETFFAKVDRLDDEAQRERLNQDQEYILFRLAGEHAVSDKGECLRIFGNVTDSAGFCAAVDGGAE